MDTPSTTKTIKYVDALCNLRDAGCELISSAGESVDIDSAIRDAFAADTIQNPSPDSYVLDGNTIWHLNNSGVRDAIPSCIGIILDSRVAAIALATAQLFIDEFGEPLNPSETDSDSTAW